MARRRRKKLKLRISFKLFLICIFVFVIYFSFFSKNKIDISKIDIINPIKLHKKQQKKYNDCMLSALNEENFNDETKNKKEEIINCAQKNGLKYTYEDLTFSYQINYNENEAVYGASLIKLVDALYLIDNDIDLSKTVKYTSQFIAGSSDGMSKRKLGEDITLKDLMKYAITVSDNSAHHMLISFIGKNNLKEYAKNLGATAIFTGSSDNYGNQITHDTNIYLKKAYELINNKENGKLLKEYMLNNRKNNLNIGDEITVAHKYGSYNIYFHDIGINFTNHPYTISVLTTRSDPAGGAYINKMSVLTKEFNDLYHTNHESYCKEYSLKKD